MYTCEKVPVQLKSQIISNVATLVQDIDTSLALSLRSRQVARVVSSNLRFGELTFSKFFSKFINHCILFSNLFMDTNYFYDFIVNNLISIFSNFTNYFLKFDLYIKNFQYLLDYEKEIRDSKTTKK